MRNEIPHHHDAQAGHEAGLLNSIELDERFFSSLLPRVEIESASGQLLLFREGNPFHLIDKAFHKATTYKQRPDLVLISGTLDVEVTGKTVNYNWATSKDISLLVEVYDSVGYDYLEHTLPRGAKVHEYLSFIYKLMKDFKLTAPWAKYDIGTGDVPYAPIKDLTQEQFQIVETNNGRYAYRDGDKEFVKAHTKFVKRYMPDVYINGVKDYKLIVNNMSYQQESGRAIYPYALHYANNTKEENANTEKQITGIEHWGDSSVCAWFKASPEEAAPRIEVKNRGISCN